MFLPTPRPTVVVYDETGTKVSETPLRSGVTVGGAAPAVTRAGDFISWWTGTSVVVFDKKLDYRYTLDALDPLGPATMMAGKLLVPLADGLGVYDPASGTAERVISIAHPQGRGPVLPAVSGSLVIEQRGSAVAGFGPS